MAIKAPMAVNCLEVGFAYPRRTALFKGLNLAVSSGEFAGILGPNGSGKSTLLKLMAGILQHRSGRIEVLGREIGGFRRRSLARVLALVPQSHTWAFPFTVAEVVAMGRWPLGDGWGWLRRADKLAVERILDLTGLNGLKDCLINEISGGERQRVFIARALAQESDIILLDEPVAHLDPRHQLEILAVLSRLHRSGKTVIMAVHDVNAAARCCTVMNFMAAGNLIVSGPPDRTITAPTLAAVFDVKAVVDLDPLTGARRVTMARTADADAENSP